MKPETLITLNIEYFEGLNDVVHLNLAIMDFLGT